MKTIDAETQKLRENILPIVRFAAKHSTFVGLLAARLGAVCPNRPPSRQIIYEWIRQDEKLRKQPRLGMGLVLIEEAGKLMRQMKKSRNGSPA